MDKKAISNALDEASVLMELAGDNPFRVRAYSNASRIVRAYAGDLAEAVADGSIRSIKGIGPAIAGDIAELLESDDPPFLQELRSRFPEGVLGMLRIPGLGPKKIRALMEELDITSIGELEYACKENRLLELPGFGAKTQENILKGIASLTAYAGRYLADTVRAEADQIAHALREVQGAQRVEVAGSLRRRKEVVKDMDIVASGDPGPLMDAVAAHSLVEEVTARGDTKLTAHLRSGLNLDLRVVPDASFPYTLQHFSGSKEHNIALRGRAHALGLKSNEYGLFKGEKNIPCKGEEDIYKKLGLAFIPPELREDMGEFEAAEKGELPELVEPEDLKGALHVHTIASDGSATLEEMVQAARDLGLSYIGITEHSASARYARGLEPERVTREADLIDRLNHKIKDFVILKGIESDILPDGSLDYPDEVLASFDFVIGSVHSNFTMQEKEMTARICRALENPYLDILGHPTGRLLLTREPYAVDMEQVLTCAAKHNKAIELNAHPYRLDIDWRLLPQAKKLGIKIAICPDAHSTAELGYTFYGLGVARKGWLEKEDVLNSLTADELRSYFANRRAK
ncbi:MAG: DNA polymerase/3'-5' exonuclease PolX [bacterium]|nr:DNA polymerase/3'-5' exonuclease PolX [bacterium]MDT8365022.1 DNA polymerase/3'-5' exonuclease PolX [bacterium]